MRNQTIKNHKIKNKPMYTEAIFQVPNQLENHSKAVAKIGLAVNMKPVK